MTASHFAGLILAILAAAAAAVSVGFKAYPIAAWFALCMLIALYAGIVVP